MITMTRSAYFNLVAPGAHTPAAEYFPLMQHAAMIARQAGGILIKYYGKNIDVEIKTADDTPVTIADKKSNDFIVTRLTRLSPSIPVVSEENDEPGGQTYWAVDPLDGTKEFIGRTKGFCVKIGLVHNLEVVAGVVFCPAQDVLYAAIKGGPAVKIVGNDLPVIITTRCVNNSNSLKTLFNKKHADFDEYKMQRTSLAQTGIGVALRPLVRAGLPRNLQVAEGLADVHLGCGTKKGSGYVWDIAPDDLILERAGGCLVHYDGSAPDYSNPRQILPGYLALGDSRLRTKLTRHPENR